jgi:hypothetical protein
VAGRIGDTTLASNAPDSPQLGSASIVLRHSLPHCEIRHILIPAIPWCQGSAGGQRTDGTPWIAKTISRPSNAASPYFRRSRTPNPWMTVSDLVQVTELSAPTVRRSLMTLERLGYARSDSNRYSLTRRCLDRLRLPVLGRPDRVGLRPLMEQLTDQTGIGTSLVTLDGGGVMYINRVQRRRITSIVLAVGRRLPAHATSMGHVLLADLDAEEFVQYLSEASLNPHARHTYRVPTICANGSSKSESAAGRLRIRNSNSAAARQQRRSARRPGR